jgi:hypothetical protein
MNLELLYDCPPRTVGHVHDTDYVTAEVFMLYLKHFFEHRKPSVDSTVLFLVDNHASHIYISAINFRHGKLVILAGFSPRISHCLQPLGVSFFGPLKMFYDEVCDSIMVSNPGKSITERRIGTLF